MSKRGMQIVTASRIIRFSLGVVCLCLLMFSAPGVQAAKNIPWQAQIFERTSFEEDIKNVLRSLIRQNGQQVIFRDGVAGQITFEFKDIPLQAAFNKLMIENGLDYDFDTVESIITISKKGVAAQISRAFIPLDSVSPGEVLAAARRFKLAGKYSVDTVARTAFIEGTAQQVKDFQGLVQRMDAASGVRRSVAVKSRQAQIAKDKSKIRRKILRQLLDRKIKVYQLRFANVAGTTTSFHGKNVTVPGVVDTLRALLGDEESVKDRVGKDGSRALRTALKRKAPTLGASLSVSADPRTNSIIARGTEEDLARVAKVLKDLDQPVPMVEMDIVIVRAERGLSETLGVNWGFERTVTADSDPFLQNRVFGLNTGIASADPSNISTALGSGSTSVVGDITTATQSVVAGLFKERGSSALQMQLEAFEQDNKSQTIASPTIVTLNNVETQIERTASQFFTVGENDEASLEEVEVGLKLAITPVVIPREDPSDVELVRLSIKINNTSISSSSIAASTASTTGQIVETEVIMPAGRTYMLGGLVDDTRTHSNQGVPFLKHLPIVGSLFETDSETDSFVETIFFITAKIVYPEDIRERDVAEKRYLTGRRLSMAGTRQNVRSGSALLENRIAFQEEDE